MFMIKVSYQILEGRKSVTPLIQVQEQAHIPAEWVHFII